MHIESFTESERVVLEQFFTNTDLPVFCLINLPEVTKAALFARYSRTGKSLRRLFLDEFWSPNDQEVIEDGSAGEQRGSELFERVLDQYGDDSVAQLGGAHIACEGVSNILTKVIERPRLGAYLEQSTRYINFADKPGGRFRFIVPDWATEETPVAGKYVKYMESQFEAYAAMVDAITKHLTETTEPPNPDDFTTTEKHEAALRGFAAAIRAEALDTCRGMLPAGTTSNLGMFATGQTYAELIKRMLASDLAEANEYGQMMLDELRKVIPQFLKRVDIENRGVRHGKYLATNRVALQNLAGASGLVDNKINVTKASVRLVRFSPLGEEAIATAALYPHSTLSAHEIANRLNDRLIDSAFRALVGDRSANRRHKPGRAFEYCDYEFDICSDYGAFRDLQRHRTLTIDWQPLSPALGYRVPGPIRDAGLETTYRDAMDRAKAMFGEIAETVGVEEARYVVPLGYMIRYSIKANARALVHMLELRTTPQAHPSYRRVCQEMFFEIRDSAAHRRVAAAMSHVNLDDVDLSRLDSETKLAEKKAT